MQRGYPNYPSNQQSGFLSDNEHQNTSFSQSEGWMNRPNSLRRPSSRSPGTQHERTPIRHHKQSFSRNRSTSKPEVLLAYATEHTAHHHSTTTTPSLPQTTPSTSPALFPTQSYSTLSPASTFVRHPQYYGGISPQFSELQGPHSACSHVTPDCYQMGGHDMPSVPLGNPNMSPNNILYSPTPGQTSGTQISALTSRNMNFTSMPTAPESTAGVMEISSGSTNPQCWDHGCGGRQFSTSSNLLRHQREKSGTAAKSRCPHCNTEFTRTTARNGHMSGGKCKGMPDQSRRSSSTEEESHVE